MSDRKGRQSKRTGKSPEVKSKSKTLTKAEGRLSPPLKSLRGYNRDFKFDLMDAERLKQDVGFVYLPLCT